MILRNNLMMGMLGGRKKLIPPEIGHFWEGQGGFYVGMLKHPTGEVYAILVSDKTRGGGTHQLTFAQLNTAPSFGTSDFDGFFNTQRFLPTLYGYPAAEFCVNYKGYGFEDWYLPAPYELNLAYRVFKPTGIENNTNSITANKYGFPISLPRFTLSDPSLTPFLEWRFLQDQSLNPSLGANLWSSQDSAINARIFVTSSGQNASTQKVSANGVRAFRRVRLKHLE